MGGYMNAALIKLIEVNVFDELRLFLQEMGVIPVRNTDKETNTRYPNTVEDAPGAFEEPMNKKYGPGEMYHYEPTTLSPHEQMPIVDFKQEFEYQWQHPTSDSWGTRKIRMDTRLDFLEQLNRWNQMGNGKWIYTEKV